MKRPGWLRWATSTGRLGASRKRKWAYRAALDVEPDWSVPAYNLGLVYKYEGRWRDSLEFNQRAAALDPNDEAAWWNLGIAATAVGEWALARQAWRACSLEMPAGDGPPDLNYGSVPLRLDPDGEGEVVWGHRMDPARARILSVPLPTSAFRWQDLVLHDGAAEGYRESHGQKVPVFNVLARLERSDFQTFIVELGTTNQEALEVLLQIAEETGGAAENWGTSTNLLCRQCSLGIPRRHPEGPSAPAHPHCGVAARDANHLRRILNEWLAACTLAAVVRWQSAPGGAL